ncbi:MAG: phage tail protein [Geminicoccaceae bacterium]|nr:MAG: phage tail protein [Geminicoccaceae bacterium]
MTDLVHVFRYRVDFHRTTLDDATSGAAEPLCRGRFSEVSGIEATMEPLAITEGGRNWGQVQRAGPTTFATLILKRGMTDDRALWTWFHGVAAGAFAYRLNARVVVLSPGAAPDDGGVLRFEFANCLPVRFKAADLSATSSEIGIEELHLQHEGLTLLGADQP